MIRVATDSDWATIPEIHRVAFGDEGDRVARLTRELRASEWYEPELSFVAEEGDALVGHVMNTWNWLEGGSPRVLQLSCLSQHRSRLCLPRRVASPPGSTSNRPACAKWAPATSGWNTATGCCAID